MADHSILLRLPQDLQREVEDLLTLASLVALGGTCEYFRDRITATLIRERHAILERYWADASLLEHITWTRAVVSGEAALGFILRDPGVLTNTLEICVSSLFAHELLGWLNTHPHPQVTLLARHPSAYVFSSTTGRAIRVLASDTHSPFAPIAAYPTTALYNYFDEFSFGCAYRNLTMNRRAVVPELRTLDHDVRLRVDRIATRGAFQQSEWAAAVAFPPVPFALSAEFPQWPGMAFGQGLLTNTRCLRLMGQCPGQSRYFGDAASLVDFFAPHLTDHAIMAHWAYPPYGTTTIWRMRSPECDYSCVNGDHLLRDTYAEPAVVTVPLSYGPFTKAVRGSIRVGESEHRRVCNSVPSDIRISTANE